MAPVATEAATRRGGGPTAALGPPPGTVDLRRRPPLRSPDGEAPPDGGTPRRRWPGRTAGALLVALVAAAMLLGEVHAPGAQDAAADPGIRLTPLEEERTIVALSLIGRQAALIQAAAEVTSPSTDVSGAAVVAAHAEAVAAALATARDPSDLPPGDVAVRAWIGGFGQDRFVARAQTVSDLLGDLALLADLDATLDGDGAVDVATAAAYAARVARDDDLPDAVRRYAAVLQRAARSGAHDPEASALRVDADAAWLALVAQLEPVEPLLLGLHLNGLDEVSMANLSGHPVARQGLDVLGRAR